MKARIKIFQPKTKSVFQPKIRWRPKKKKRFSLKFRPVFGQKKVFAHRYCAQTVCPSYKGGLCHNFAYFSILIILSWRPKGGPWPNDPFPTKYAPATSLRRSTRTLARQNYTNVRKNDASSFRPNYVQFTKHKFLLTQMMVFQSVVEHIPNNIKFFKLCNILI